MPQCAMAQAGSAFAIRSNCGRASSYQKSWSKATPRLKGARTDAEQDTEKDTSPSFSPAGAAVGAGAGVAMPAVAPVAAGLARGRAVSARRRGVNIFMGRQFYPGLPRIRLTI